MEADDDYVPVSARVEFRLQAVKEAEELAEFKQLQDQAEAVIKEKQVALKKLVIETIKLERKVLQEKLNRHFCESIFLTTKLFLTAQSVDTAQSHHTVARMLEQHSAPLLKHTGCTVEEFTALYKATLQVGDQPPATVDAQSPQHVGCIKRALESVFVLSWDRYLHQTKENALSISLKKEVKEQLLWCKTDDATMIIDNELPVDHEQLQDLIRREAEAMAKKFARKEATAQLDSAKNSKRGQAAMGASNKKKKDSNRKENEKEKGKDNKKEKERKQEKDKKKGTKEGKNRRRSQSHTRRNDRRAGEANSDSEHAASCLRQRRSKSKQQKQTRTSNRGRQQS
jgi:hypothetical protein